MREESRNWHIWTLLYDKSNDQRSWNGCPFPPPPSGQVERESILTKWKQGFGGSPNQIIIKIKWGLPQQYYDMIMHIIMTFLKALLSPKQIIYFSK
jgi:hypothetical protein